MGNSAYSDRDGVSVPLRGIGLERTISHGVYLLQNITSFRPLAGNWFGKVVGVRPDGSLFLLGGFRPLAGNWFGKDRCLVLC